MKTVAFIIITLLSGAIAGTFLGLINQAMVEPFIDEAIEIEIQNMISEGEIVDRQEFNNIRLWQKGGEIVAGTILGISIGALFGLVFAFVRNSLPGSNEKKKGMVLAGIMFIVLFLVPALKYPGNPPAVGNPETIVYRQSLYIGMLAISGFSALGLALLYQNIGYRRSKEISILLISLSYIAIITVAFILLPTNPDGITISMDLVLNFRIITALTMGLFWGILGIVLGSFWDKTKPHETTRIAAF
jgi:predicted cobalt transporter CbtA